MSKTITKVRRKRTNSLTTRSPQCILKKIRESKCRTSRKLTRKQTRKQTSRLNRRPNKRLNKRPNRKPNRKPNKKWNIR
jgi:hypothetical protein